MPVASPQPISRPPRVLEVRNQMLALKVPGFVSVPAGPLRKAVPVVAVTGVLMQIAVPVSRRQGPGCR